LYNDQTAALSGHDTCNDTLESRWMKSETRRGQA